MIEASVKRSNKTCRGRGAVGKNAIVPKWIEANVIAKDNCILDFGSGKDMMHVKELRDKGFFIAGSEFGDNVTDEHIPCLPNDFFNFVYASNVFNTHDNPKMSAEALHTIKATLKNNGYLVYNMPTRPCYHWTITEFNKLVAIIFGWSPIKVDNRGIYMVKKDKYADKTLF